MRTTFVRTRDLLKTFRVPYLQFLAGVAIRQVMFVVGGYSLVWLLHRSQHAAAAPVWACLAGLLLYDLCVSRLDLVLNNAFVSRISFPMFASLRSKALSKFFEMPLEWHIRQDSGERPKQINESIGRVVQTAEGISRELSPAVIRTVLALIPLVYLSPFTSIFICTAIAAFIAITLSESKQRQPYRKERHKNYARDFGRFSECVEYVHPIVQFGQGGRVLNEYAELQNEIAMQGIAEIKIGSRFAELRAIVLSATKRVCQAIWIWQFTRRALDPAMVMYLNALLEDLFGSFSGYAGLIEKLYDGMEPARTLVTFFDEKPAISDAFKSESRKPESLATEPVGIEMRNVGFAYDDRPAVLSNLNLEVEPGSILGVVGRSGVGKTTLQHLLSRVYDVGEGEVLVCGRDVRDWPLDHLRGIFAPVSQNGGVFFSSASILDIIRFARPAASFEEAVKAAKCAAIHREIIHLPDGYQTKAGQRGVTLSQGQRQRLALAQALVALEGGRRVLILDEFTSALDSKTEQEILRNLAPALEGKTAIIIAHRLATLRNFATKIVVLDKSGIIEAGGHAELLRLGGSYAELASLQAIA